MELIQHLGTILGLSFISGINLYATVAVVGLAIKNGLVSGLPPDFNILANNAVIAVALALYLVEFFMDKIPGMDTAWDAIHTFIRPLGGALLALMQVGDSSPALQVIVFMLGASLASTAHFTKAGVRLLVNASPEPVSNFVLSISEDAGAVGLSYLSIAHPGWAFFIMLLVLVVVGLTVPVLVRTIRMLFAALLSKVLGFLGGRGASGGNVGLSPAQDTFLARHRNLDEKILWIDSGYAGKIPGIARSAKLLVVVTDRSIHCLRRRLGGFRHNQMRLDDIQRQQVYPGRLLSKVVIFGTHETWSLQFLPSVARSLPAKSVDSKEVATAS